MLSIQELREAVQSWLYTVLYCAFEALVYQYFLGLDECFPVEPDNQGGLSTLLLLLHNSLRCQI